MNWTRITVISVLTVGVVVALGYMGFRTLDVGSAETREENRESVQQVLTTYVEEHPVQGSALSAESPWADPQDPDSALVLALDIASLERLGQSPDTSGATEYINDRLAATDYTPSLLLEDSVLAFVTDCHLDEETHESLLENGVEELTSALEVSDFITARKVMNSLRNFGVKPAEYSSRLKIMEARLLQDRSLSSKLLMSGLSGEAPFIPATSDRDDLQISPLVTDALRHAHTPYNTARQERLLEQFVPDGQLDPCGDRDCQTDATDEVYLIWALLALTENSVDEIPWLI